MSDQAHTAENDAPFVHTCGVYASADCPACSAHGGVEPETVADCSSAATDERHIVVSYRQGHLRVMPGDREHYAADAAALREAADMLAPHAGCNGTSTKQHCEGTVTADGPRACDYCDYSHTGACAGGGWEPDLSRLVTKAEAGRRRLSGNSGSAVPTYWLTEDECAMIHKYQGTSAMFGVIEAIILDRIERSSDPEGDAAALCACGHPLGHTWHLCNDDQGRQLACDGTRVPPGSDPA